MFYNIKRLSFSFHDVKFFVVPLANSVRTISRHAQNGHVGPDGPTFHYMCALNYVKVSDA